MSHCDVNGTLYFLGSWAEYHVSIGTENKYLDHVDGRKKGSHGCNPQAGRTAAETSLA